MSVPQSNTINLFNHLKAHHKLLYDECMKAKQNATAVANSEHAQHKNY